MRSVILLLSLMALGGCMKVSDMAAGTEYHLRDAGVLDHSDTRRASSWRLQADSFVFISQAHYTPPGDAHPRPNVVAEQAFDAFVEYFPLVRRAAQPQGLEEALNEARTAGAHYLLYTRFAAADDRIGTEEEWEDQEALDRLGVDSSVIQLMLIETNTRYLVDTARIRNRGGFLTLYDTKPQDLLRPAFEQYARSLIGVSDR
ncbi:DUF4823 domain-containing protein [Pseudomonas alcaligenes]|uniref:DUF4823 domain-containing protein n=1 Tax=Aquipseudomonas alcaligenes TaxID=43263 RepID=A0ABR7S3D0_AQUAC|nr:DUF4823 domain-containing protein [Pseudomonas alcaligenes]MBC9251325.1 DUF4823 domain-containing protein [Pseudomonas alcaligenes]